jgi:transposase
MEAEITRLRKELASAKLDIEILRKATAYCVSRTQA